MIPVKSEERREKSSISHHTSAISHLLKWVFAVICAVGVLIITIKVRDERRLRADGGSKRAEG